MYRLWVIWKILEPSGICIVYTIFLEHFRASRYIYGALNVDNH